MSFNVVIAKIVWRSYRIDAPSPAAAVAQAAAAPERDGTAIPRGDDLAETDPSRALVYEIDPNTDQCSEDHPAVFVKAGGGDGAPADRDEWIEQPYRRRVNGDDCC